MREMPFYPDECQHGEASEQQCWRCLRAQVATEKAAREALTAERDKFRQDRDYCAKQADTEKAAREAAESMRDAALEMHDEELAAERAAHEATRERLTLSNASNDLLRARVAGLENDIAEAKENPSFCPNCACTICKELALTSDTPV